MRSLNHGSAIRGRIILLETFSRASIKQIVVCMLLVYISLHITDSIYSILLSDLLIAFHEIHNKKHFQLNRVIFIYLVI